jgi:hypothetical protein
MQNYLGIRNMLALGLKSKILPHQAGHPPRKRQRNLDFHSHSRNDFQYNLFRSYCKNPRKGIRSHPHRKLTSRYKCLHKYLKRPR